MENLTLKQKMTNVLKRYGYYFILGILVVGAVLTMILVGVSEGNKNKLTPTNSSTITPYMPVLNATLYKGYFADELTYNSTLKQWETHNGIDLQVASGSSVYSILDGKVKDVYTNILDGTVIVIEHNNGLTSEYSSLGSDVKVKVGDNVSRGDIIGAVSESANRELEAGAHLHFSMKDNGKKIDPAAYLNISSNK